MTKSISQDNGANAAQEPNLLWTWKSVEDALRGLQYGSILLQIQDGVVVQVERTERKRYQRSSTSPERERRAL
jgi:hypothetical protein